MSTWRNIISSCDVTMFELRCKENLEFEPNDNPLFWAIVHSIPGMIDILMSYDVHKECDINLLYLLSVTNNNQKLTEFTIESGANINFVPSLEFLQVYCNANLNTYTIFFTCRTSVTNLDDYIMFCITKNKTVSFWDSNLPLLNKNTIDLKYLINHGVDLTVGNCEYLQYEINNSNGVIVFETVIQYIDIPKKTLEYLGANAIKHGKIKSYKKIFDIVTPTDDMAREILKSWSERCNIINSFWDILNVGLDFFIDHIYQVCTQRTRDYFAEVIHQILNCLLVVTKLLFSVEIFEKLFSIGIDLFPYLKWMIMLGFCNDRFDVVKFVRKHYDISAIMKDLEDDIYNIK